MFDKQDEAEEEKENSKRAEILNEEKILLPRHRKSWKKNKEKEKIKKVTLMRTLMTKRLFRC